MVGITLDVINKAIILNEWNEFRKAISADTDEDWAAFKQVFFAGAFFTATSIEDVSEYESIDTIKETLILNKWNEFREALYAETDEDWAMLKHTFFSGAVAAATKMMDSPILLSLGILKELQDWGASVNEQCQE